MEIKPDNTELDEGFEEVKFDEGFEEVPIGGADKKKAQTGSQKLPVSVSETPSISPTEPNQMGDLTPAKGAEKISIDPRRLDLLGYTQEAAKKQISENKIKDEETFYKTLGKKYSPKEIEIIRRGDIPFLKKLNNWEKDKKTGNVEPEMSGGMPAEAPLEPTRIFNPAEKNERFLKGDKRALGAYDKAMNLFYENKEYTDPAKREEFYADLTKQGFSTEQVESVKKQAEDSYQYKDSTLQKSLRTLISPASSMYHGVDHGISQIKLATKLAEEGKEGQALLVQAEGMASILFGVANAYGPFALFTMGLTGAEEADPTKTVSKLLTAPTEFYKGVSGKSDPESEGGKAALRLADLAWMGLLFHGKSDAQKLIAQKIKDNQPVTEREIETVMYGLKNMTPEQRQATIDRYRDYVARQRSLGKEGTSIPSSKELSESAMKPATDQFAAPDYSDKKMKAATARKELPFQLTPAMSVQKVGEMLNVSNPQVRNVPVTFQGEVGRLHRSETGEVIFKSESGKETIIGGGGDTRSLAEVGVEAKGLHKDAHGSYFVEEVNDGFAVYEVKDGGALKPVHEGDVINEARRTGIIASALGLKFEEVAIKELEIKLQRLIKDRNKTDNLAHKEVIQRAINKVDNQVTALTQSLAEKNASLATTEQKLADLYEQKKEMEESMKNMDQDAYMEMMPELIEITKKVTELEKTKTESVPEPITEQKTDGTVAETPPEAPKPDGKKVSFRNEIYDVVGETDTHITIERKTASGPEQLELKKDQLSGENAIKEQTTQEKLDAIKKERAEIWDEINKSRNKFNAGGNAELVIRLALNYMKEGYVKFEDFAREFIKDAKRFFDKEITEADAREAFDMASKRFNSEEPTKTKIVERPDFENPIHSFEYKGKEYFVQKYEQMNGGTEWMQVVKDSKGRWEGVKHHKTYPYEYGIGYTKKEAVDFLVNKHAKPAGEDAGTKTKQNGKEQTNEKGRQKDVLTESTEPVSPVVKEKLDPNSNIDIVTTFREGNPSDFYIIDNSGKKIIKKPFDSFKEANDALNKINEDNGFGEVREEPTGDNSALRKKVAEDLAIIKENKNKETYNLNLTPATDVPSVPEITSLFERAKELFKEGKHEEANKLYDQILDIGEKTLKDSFDKIPGAEIALDRSKGNYFGGEEPTFIGELTITDGKSRQAAFDALADFAEKYQQRTIHISTVTKNLPEGAKYGVENPDGSVYEPNIDIRFKEPLTDAEYKKISSEIQRVGREGEELAGSTLHPDKKGVTLYNISKFKDHGTFIEQVKDLTRILQDSGRILESPKLGARRLWNYGEKGDGATRGYEQLREGSIPDRLSPKEARDAAISREKAKAWSDWRKAGGGRAFSLLDPAVIGPIVRLAKAYLKQGIAKFEDFSDWMKKELTSNGFTLDKKSDSEIRQIYEKARREVYDDMTPEEMYNHVDAIRERTQKKVEEIDKTSWEKIKSWANTYLVDRAASLRDALAKMDTPESYTAIMYRDMVNKSGARARMHIEEMDSQIFRGLSESEMADLTNIITARRDIARNDISDKRVAKGGEPIKNTDGLLRKDYEKVLQEMKDRNPENYDKLWDIADEYFDQFNTMLDMKEQNGLISPELKAALKENIAYSPTLYLQHMENEGLAISGNPISGKSGLKKLAEGSEQDKVQNPKYLLARSVELTHNLIAVNDAAKAMMRLAMESPDNGIVYVKDIIGYNKKTGEPLWADTPTGYTTIKAMVDGKPVEMAFDNKYIKDWTASDTEIGRGARAVADIVQWITGSTMLRAMATGYNPAFGLANVPRDVSLILLTTPHYSPVLPKGISQITNDILHVAKDAATRSGQYKEFIEEGGGIDFLTQEGQFHITGDRSNPTMHKINHVLGYIGETSELVTRLAIRRRVIENETKKLGHTPSPAELAEIKKKATYEAVNYLDFSQGGRLTKSLNNYIPYINAASQALRVTVRSAKKDPKRFAAVSAQMIGIAGGLYYWNSQQDGFEYISDDTKVRNFIIMLPFFNYTDSEGKKVYPHIKIPKGQEVQPIAQIGESIAGMANGDKPISKRLWMSTKNAMPPIPFITQNTPVGEAIRTYQSNYDAFYDRPLWRGYDKNLPAEYEYYTESWRKTPEHWKQIGKATGMSPERLRQSLPKMFANLEQNPFVAAPMKAANIFEDVATGERDEIGKAMGKHIKEVLGSTYGKYYGTAFAYKDYSEGMADVQREKSIETKDRSDFINEAIESGLTESQFKTQVKKEFSNVASKEQINRMEKAFEKKLKQKGLDPFYIAIINDDPDIRAARIKSRLNDATPEETAEVKRAINKLIKDKTIPWSGVFSDELKKNKITGIHD